jgi:uncharacterized protein DUF1236
MKAAPQGQASRRQLEPPKAAPKIAPAPAMPGQSKSAEGPSRNASGKQLVNRSQITNEQRMRVRTTVLKEKVGRIQRSRANFAVSVGSHVPRRHRLHRLPPAIFAFAPLYSGYSYLLVDDTICIVDPDTYVVVDVIPATIEQALTSPPRPALHLSPEEMQFVWHNVPKDMARTDARVRLALGAAIRADVELFRFPARVIDRIPQLEAFRFVVVGDDVVVADPVDRGVALVISE